MSDDTREMRWADAWYDVRAVDSETCDFQPLMAEADREQAQLRAEVETIREAERAAGLPPGAGVAGLIRHHRGQGAIAADADGWTARRALEQQLAAVREDLAMKIEAAQMPDGEHLSPERIEVYNMGLREAARIVHEPRAGLEVPDWLPSAYRAFSGGDDTYWRCPKPGCDLDADHHSMALVIEHVYRMTPQDAQAKADAIISKGGRTLPAGGGER